MTLAFWLMHVVTSAQDLNNGSQVTGVYLDYIDDGTVDPFDLLTTTPDDLAGTVTDADDWVSTEVIFAQFGESTPGEYFVGLLENASVNLSGTT
jgi:hypothetical protein